MSSVEKVAKQTHVQQEELYIQESYTPGVLN